MPVNSPVRVAVLGCADIAVRRMLPAMAACADVELVAVASRDAARAEGTARRFGCAAVHGYEALLAREDVDAVYVPLPAALHDVWVEAALRAGKHVLAEKPLTTRQERTAELLRLARARGLALVENVLFVHHGQHAAVRALLRDGAIGEPRSLHAAFAVPARPDEDIRYRAALGGGALWDVGVYPVRAALHLLGSGLTVLGAVLTADAGREVDTSGAALLRDGAGTVAQLTFGIGHAYRSEYELRGTEGRITVDRAFTPPADHRPVLRVERGSRVEEIALAPEDQVAAAVTAFATAVRQGGAPSDETVLEQAALLDAIRRSAGRTH
ncbi:oxidoreductase [Streptomyces sp. ERV7]|uniref:Gfo/Idh/MocA family protein n=1 Tax=Streptomyces sp. ERV7 TaxID=1322334 RepID=UPI0007F48E4E|nr:Gfo/Idh/MocA family oxidoreductase [Streptomyces sp. ERV7]OAR24147.1 oxidoreductase [Streptomyces sp. ERV7]